MRKTLILFFIACLAMTAIQCDNSNNDTGSSSNRTSENDTLDTMVTDTVIQQGFDELFANVPSPYVMSRMLESSGARPTPNLLHDPKATSGYLIERDRALNMGIYAVDLTYSHVMDLGTNEIEYMAAVLTLARELGLGKVFREDLLTEMRNNLENKDVILEMINDTYGELESYLKEEHREGIAAYMMAGGVVEIIYLGTQIAEQNDVLKTAMADQSIGINSIIKIIERLGPSAENEEVLNDLNNIIDVFNRMEVSGEQPTVLHSDNGDVSIGSKPSKVLTPELYAELKDLINEIRSDYVEK